MISQSDFIAITSEAGTLAGTKCFMFIGRWLAADFCHTKAIYVVAGKVLL